MNTIGIVASVRSTTVKKAARTRQCFECLTNITKKHPYVNHQFRYDKKIITLSYHLDCNPIKRFK